MADKTTLFRKSLLCMFVWQQYVPGRDQSSANPLTPPLTSSLHLSLLLLLLLLRSLDLSNNYLPSAPHNVWHIMPRLRTLSLARNPIKVLANDSFLALERLEELDVSRLPLATIEQEALATLPALATLRISIGGGLQDVNLAQHLVSSAGLRHLHLVFASTAVKLRHTLQADLPPRLNQVQGGIYCYCSRA